MIFPKYTPDYAKVEFERLMEIYEKGKEFDILVKWCTDSRMKQVYESLESLEMEDKGYFIFAMFDSGCIDLDKFRREENLINKLDADIANHLEKLSKLIFKRKRVHSDVPKYYDEILDCKYKSHQEEHIPFTPEMIKIANDTRQTKSPRGKLNNARLARAFIVNLSHNKFDVGLITTAIEYALNVIYSDPEESFSRYDVENCIKGLRKKRHIPSQNIDPIPSCLKLPSLEYNEYKCPVCDGYIHKNLHENIKLNSSSSEIDRIFLFGSESYPLCICGDLNNIIK